MKCYIFAFFFVNTEKFSIILTNTCHILHSLLDYMWKLALSTNYLSYPEYHLSKIKTMEESMQDSHSETG